MILQTYPSRAIATARRAATGLTRMLGPQSLPHRPCGAVWLMLAASLVLTTFGTAGAATLPNDPDLAPHLKLRLRGDDLTAAHNDSDPVSAWIDASAAGNDATALTSTDGGSSPLVDPVFTIIDVPALLVQGGADQLMKTDAIFGGGGFTDVTFAPAANNGPLVIGGHFNSTGQLDSTFDGLIDELRVTAGFVPESELLAVQDPTALVLAALGLAGLLCFARRGE